MTNVCNRNVHPLLRYRMVQAQMNIPQVSVHCCDWHHLQMMNRQKKKRLSPIKTCQLIHPIAAQEAQEEALTDVYSGQICVILRDTIYNYCSTWCVYREEARSIIIPALTAEVLCRMVKTTKSTKQLVIRI